VLFGEKKGFRWTGMLKEAVMREEDSIRRGDLLSSNGDREILVVIKVGISIGSNTLTSETT
jgi:hypothetical protein